MVPQMGSKMKWRSLCQQPTIYGIMACSIMGFRTKQTPLPARRRAVKNKREEQLQRTAYTYRRNRTLTGSLVSRVPSAGESKAQLRSPRMHAHDLRRTRRRVALSLGVVVGLLAAVWFALDNVIATPVVAGNLTSNHQLYQAKINDYLTAHPLERFRFALNTSRLAAYLQTHDCPEVAAVLPATQQAGLGRSTITLAMRQAAVVWTVNRQQLFVDTEGHAFRRAYGPRPSIEVVDDSGIDTRNNQVVASNQFLGFIGKVVGAVRRHQLTVQKITLPAGTTRQIYVWFTGVEYPVKFSVDRSAGLQSEDAARAIRYLAQHHITPKYLDVRVSGRAAYR